MTTTNNAIDTTAPNTPVAAAPALDDSGQFVTLSSLLIVAAATAAITLFAVYAGASKGYFPGTRSASSASKVVMLDVDRIAEAAISANAKKGPGTDPKADVELFQSNLKKEIDQLSADGFMVVNYRAVVAASKNADVTDQLITRLGLNTGEVK